MTRIRMFSSALLALALPLAGEASAALPLLNATCPGGLEVHVDEGGPVYVNGREATLKRFNDNYYEARDAQSGTTISINRAADGSVDVSYTGKGRANGVCTVAGTAQSAPAAANAPAAPASQDKVTTVPVHFARGSSSASLKGTIGGYGTAHYILDARGGQTLTVRIDGSNNANFNVFAPGDEPGSSTAIGTGYVGQPWTGALPVTGSYTVQVYQPRATARRNEKASYGITLSVH